MSASEQIQRNCHQFSVHYRKTSGEGFGDIEGTLGLLRCCDEYWLGIENL